MKNLLRTTQLTLLFCGFVNLLSAQSVAVKLNLTDFVRGVGGNIELSKGNHFSMLGEYQYLKFDKHHVKDDWFSGGKEYESWLNMNGWRSSVLLRYFPKSVHKGFFTEGGAYLGHYKGGFTYHKYQQFLFGTSSEYTESIAHFNESVSGVRLGMGAQIRNNIMVFELSGGVSLNFNTLYNKIKPFANDANIYIRAACGFVASKEKPAPQTGKYRWFSGK